MYAPSAKIANPRKDIVRWWNGAMKRLKMQIKIPNREILNESKINSLFVDTTISINSAAGKSFSILGEDLRLLRLLWKKSTYLTCGFSMTNYNSNRENEWHYQSIGRLLS
jgi:hypothetical protein